MADLKLELPEGLYEVHALNVPDGPTQLQSVVNNNINNNRYIICLIL